MLFYNENNPRFNYKPKSFTRRNAPPPLHATTILYDLLYSFRFKFQIQIHIQI
jgi:hypothetical protein